jgi:hypothetical protein
MTQHCTRVISLSFSILFFLLFGQVVAIGDVNHDRPYLDLPGMPITLTSSQNEQDCANLCANNTECVAWAYSMPNCGGSGVDPQCWLKGDIPQIVPAQCRISGLKDLSILPKKFTAFPLGSVMPQGWLQEQLQIQADGLSGHLSLFWPDINQSAWIGNPSGDSFERVPYWLNGLVPLAFLLQEQELYNQVNLYIDYILAHQSSDGWLGPTCCDPWPRFPLLLALMQYAEAKPEDTRIVPALWKFFNNLRSTLDSTPLSSWAQYRWQDLVIVIHWMLDNYPQGQEQFLLDFAEQAHNQGFDWGAFFASDQFPTGPCTGTCPSLATHGVNVGQALKSGAVWYRQSRSSSDWNSSYERTNVLYQYHGLASGIFGCDEHLAGNMPSHGSELCTVVETMYSFEIMQEVFGDPGFGDRVERLAFNALPATFTFDMWAHQYLQQSNEINSQHLSSYIYVTDGPDSNIYGLEPNFGCCTANFNQGWPKYTTHMFAKTLDHGIAAMLYGPSVLTTEINNEPVVIDLSTQYPFGETLTFAIKTGIAFPFYLRIPAWANNATVQIDDGQTTSVPAGEFYAVKIAAGQTTVLLTLPMEFYVTRRYNNAVSIYYGPILFALDIPANWTELAHYAFNSSDWQALPIGPWAFAINISDTNPAEYLKMTQRAMGKYPFSELGSPYVVTAEGKPLEGWGVYFGAAEPPPVSPISSTHPSQPLTLLPFGATKLRIAELPTLQ